MNIIVSHDVDHLYGRDHWFRDFVYPKLWVRETLQLICGKITGGEWWGRCISCFRKRRNYIPELIEYDRSHGIPSTFFFGMAKGLGMSYEPEEAKGMIQYVKDQGFGVGVHGICYDADAGIEAEKKTFTELMGFEPDGIRMHYVRFDEKTLSRLDKAGYAFDTTEFDKQTGTCMKGPYKVGNMWEFPLSVMDGYIPYPFEKAKEKTLELLNRLQAGGIETACILFHDSQFCGGWGQTKRWYEWVTQGLKDEMDICFVSYKDAICVMEGEND